MICTLTKLFWQKLSPKQCGGWSKNIGEINYIKDSVEALLASNKCLGDKQSFTEIPTKFHLLVNRLCPYQIKMEALNKVDICQNHFVSFIWQWP